MKNKQRLDFLREIRGSWTRYFSIMLIVALGVAFFAGVRSSEPDMKISVDEYYDSVNYYDIRLASTIGFTEEDFKAISETEGVLQAESAYYTEAFYKKAIDSKLINSEEKDRRIRLDENINDYL